MWTADKQTGDLRGAIEYFHTKLPGWWFSVGACHVSADASCAPDTAGCDYGLLKEEPEEVRRYFDSMFEVDLLPPATMADALRRAADIAFAARDTYYMRKNLQFVKDTLRERFGIND